MPTYEYLCDSCGEFSAIRPMSEYRSAHACPTCGTSAPRVLGTAPAIAGMPAAARTAHAVNERSTHAPATSGEYKAKHGSGCGCCGGVANRRSSAATAADGSKSFPAKRPWMISH